MYLLVLNDYANGYEGIWIRDKSWAIDGLANWVYELAYLWGKEPTFLQKDIRGFVTNRLMYAVYREIAQATGHQILVSGIGPVVHTGFTDMERAVDFRDVLRFDKGKLKSFMAALHDKGLRVIGRGLWYISAVHTEAEIDQALGLAKEVLIHQEK
uniref:hypothetical protein n=1 Tax=Cyclobacterium salsum TaxID=2666329 RepID=UPI00293BB543|nr:hypothetical protein [Cyclobacterium salsum]